MTEIKGAYLNGKLFIDKTSQPDNGQTGKFPDDNNWNSLNISMINTCFKGTIVSYLIRNNILFINGTIKLTTNDIQDVVVSKLPSNITDAIDFNDDKISIGIQRIYNQGDSATNSMGQDFVLQERAIFIDKQGNINSGFSSNELADFVWPPSNSNYSNETNEDICSVINAAIPLK